MLLPTVQERLFQGTYFNDIFRSLSVQSTAFVLIFSYLQKPVMARGLG